MLDLTVHGPDLLKAYVPIRQVGSQVNRFLVDHLGHPIPSPALRSRFRKT